MEPKQHKNCHKNHLPTAPIPKCKSTLPRKSNGSSHPYQCIVPSETKVRIIVDGQLYLGNKPNSPNPNMHNIEILTISVILTNFMSSAVK